MKRRGAAEARGDGWKEKEGEDAAQPRWLGSLARRNDADAQTGGAGWADPEEPEGPRWLGSMARLGEKFPAIERPAPGGDPARSLYLVDVEPGSDSVEIDAQQQNAPAAWQGSGSRACLNEVHQTEPEFAPEPPLPGDELGERREGRYVVGALGMRLRVVA